MANTKAKVRGRKGKLGKNKSRIVAYYSENRWEINKARRLVRHLRRYGKDPKAEAALKLCLAGMRLDRQRDFQKQYNL